MDSHLPELHGVAQRLRYVRERLGLTRAELEAALRTRGAPHCSVMTIRRNETGTRSPTVEELAALARYADVSLCWLVDGRTSGHPAPDPAGAEQEFVRGLLDAELARSGPAVRAGFERAESRLTELRAAGRLGDVAWSHWLAIRHGAILAGAYRQDDA